jgi:hypothetical protein
LGNYFYGAVTFIDQKLRAAFLTKSCPVRVSMLAVGIKAVAHGYLLDCRDHSSVVMPVWNYTSFSIFSKTSA